MTCICGAPIFHVEFVQTIRDDRVPFEIYHWHCPACSTLMEELRLGANTVHQNSIHPEVSRQTSSGDDRNRRLRTAETILRSLQKSPTPSPSQSPGQRVTDQSSIDLFSHSPCKSIRHSSPKSRIQL